MTAIGGPLESITIAGQRFPVAGDADTSRTIGGDENEIEYNGDKTARLIKTVKGWSLTGVTLSIDDTLGQQESLQDIADSKEFHAFSVTYASGETYSGTGQIVGELTFSNSSSTASCGFGGPGKLQKQ